MLHVGANQQLELRNFQNCIYTKDHKVRVWESFKKTIALFGLQGYWIYHKMKSLRSTEHRQDLAKRPSPTPCGMCGEKPEGSKKWAFQGAERLKELDLLSEEKTEKSHNKAFQPSRICQKGNSLFISTIQLNSSFLTCSKETPSCKDNYTNKTEDCMVLRTCFPPSEGRQSRTVF